MAKTIYEVEFEGQIYEVEADDPEQAAAAFEAPQRTAGELGVGDWLEGMWDIGMAAVTGAVAQPVSGIAGLAGAGTGYLINKFSEEPVPNAVMDNAAAWQEYTEGLLTNTPDGEAAQLFLQTIGPTVDFVARKADDAFYSMAGGDAEIAAGIKTAVYGIPSVLGLKNMKLGKRFSNWERTRSIKEDLAKEASKEGIPLDSQTLPHNVKAYGEKLVGDPRRGIGFDELLNDLRTAKGLSEADVNDAYKAARATNAVAEIAPITKTLRNTTRQLFEEGADPSWGLYNRSVKELDNLTEAYTGLVRNKQFKFSDPRTHIDLNELDIMRRRISRRVDTVGAQMPEGRALIKLRESLDSAVDDLFESAAIDGGPEAVALWKKARGLARTHAQNFNADKTLSKMLLKNLTPEDAYKFLLGASKIGGKTESVQTIQAMKRILGPSHASIAHIRKAAIRDIFAPLFKERANFNAVINNIDTAMREHYSLLQELDIPTNDLTRFKQLAIAAQHSAAMNPTQFDGAFWTGMVSSITVGHQIARKGALVRGSRKLMNKWLDIGILSKEDLRSLLFEAEFGDVPIIEYSKPEVALWLAAGATSAEMANAGE